MASHLAQHRNSEAPHSRRLLCAWVGGLKTTLRQAARPSPFIQWSQAGDAAHPSKRFIWPFQYRRATSTRAFAKVGGCGTSSSSHATKTMARNSWPTFNPAGSKTTSRRFTLGALDQNERTGISTGYCRSFGMTLAFAGQLRSTSKAILRCGANKASTSATWAKHSASSGSAR